jgi:hypothetical protein
LLVERPLDLEALELIVYDAFLSKNIFKLQDEIIVLENGELRGTDE